MRKQSILNQLGTCGNELCFGENAVCQLNKLSVFFLHAILLCTLWGMGLMLKDLRGPMRGGMGHAAQVPNWFKIDCFFIDFKMYYFLIGSKMWDGARGTGESAPRLAVRRLSHRLLLHRLRD
jgi:hypothetical protein